jgi:hypothetical protein
VKAISAGILNFEKILFMSLLFVCEYIEVICARKL